MRPATPPATSTGRPGVRVRVRFHGRLVDAFVLERRSDTDHVGKLGWLDRVVSAEPVLTPDVRRLVDGPIVWAPAVEGAVVLSTRGGDFELSVGQDFSLGYLDHGKDRVRLYIQESFTFQPLSPQAAVPLVYGAKPAKRR